MTFTSNGKTDLEWADEENKNLREEVAQLTAKLAALQADYDRGLPSLIRTAGLEAANETIEALIVQLEKGVSWLKVTGRNSQATTDTVIDDLISLAQDLYTQLYSSVSDETYRRDVEGLEKQIETIHQIWSRRPKLIFFIEKKPWVLFDEAWEIELDTAIGTDL